MITKQFDLLLQAMISITRHYELVIPGILRILF